MPVRSRRLFGPVVVTTSLAAVYVVPAGRTAIARSLWFSNQSATVEATIDLYLNGQNTSFRIARITVPIGGSSRILGELILNPGDTLYAIRGADAVVLSAYGSLLLGAPE